jgi:meiotically up-regulated gene 157 (Mug157) protein
MKSFLNKAVIAAFAYMAVIFLLYRCRCVATNNMVINYYGSTTQPAATSDTIDLSHVYSYEVEGDKLMLILDDGNVYEIDQ